MDRVQTDQLGHVFDERARQKLVAHGTATRLTYGFRSVLVDLDAPEEPIADFDSVGEFTIPLCCGESTDTKRRQPWQ